MTSRVPAVIVHGGAGADPASGREELRRGIRDAVTAMRHPVSLARLILEDGRHSFFVGEGAMARARTLGVPFCDPEELITDTQRKRLESLIGGTVDAVALDRRGLIAAATSTGGTAGKLAGRVGAGGLICVDWKGRLGWAHSTPLMPVGFMSPGHNAPALTF